ncbi:MAG: L,D-transpeptidase family protein [Candidatus Sulfotelmatobacter sp.]
MRTLAASILFFAFLSFGSAKEPPGVVDQVVVYKRERTLVLLSQGEEIKSYRIAPVGPKTRQGDHRTPEGSYVLDSRNPGSHFYKAFHISYPSSNDIASAKKLGANPGGNIMLHGLPKNYAWIRKAHTLHDWTDGCIAVTNKETDEIWTLVRVGTPIEIKP